MSSGVHDTSEFVTGLARVPRGIDASSAGTDFEQFQRHTVWDKPGGLANRFGAGDLDVVIHSARKRCRLALAWNRTVLLALFVPDDKVVSRPLRRRARGQRSPLRCQAGCLALPRLPALAEVSDDRRGGAHTNRPELVAVHGYDTKFTMNALRLSIQRVEFHPTGRITLPVPEPQRSYLRRVRRGGVDLDEVVAEGDAAEARLGALRDGSELLDEPDEQGDGSTSGSTGPTSSFWSQ